MTEPSIRFLDREGRLVFESQSYPTQAVVTDYYGSRTTYDVTYQKPAHDTNLGYTLAGFTRAPLRRMAALLESFDDVAYGPNPNIVLGEN